ncbi:hypothetical protein [Aquimarina muelleri]|uniref:Uncharacterized protein n=1 Tax=Aquimarina muelleri TaxID=279356 RepID=A0A918N1M1_9FLAO|nr:hypothetical protein [Aquimarina muelleri]MCX2764039.1 hypothetical protein [Aquimarina muelleri]GGX11994.1 hypothetical protein GCM10007384_12150 [Aquimarina muelleri]
MKKNEELFYLIQSLTKSEKRYFKITAQGNDATEYLALFDAIESQKEYNEAKIKEQFKDKAFITQLTTIKNYLKQRILQSLRNYHSKISKNAELTDILRNVEILYHKGQYTICNSELQRAEKKAENFQQDILLFHIQDWKRKVYQAQYPQDFETLRKIIKNQKKTLKSTNEYIDLLLANIDPNQFSLSHKKSISLQNRTLKTLHKYRKQLLAEHPEKAKQTLEDLIKEWEQNPELLKEYFSIYLSINNNLLGFLVLKKQHKEAYVRILLLKQKASIIPTVSASIIKEKLRLYNIELKIHRHLKDLHHTHEVINEIQNFIELHNTLVPNSYWLSFRFQFANIYFLKKDNKKALTWINDILNNQNKKDRQDLITYTYWLNLLVHYELGNNLTLKHLIEIVKKHLKKQKNIDSYEKKLLKFLSKTSEYTANEKRIAFINLKQQLEVNPIPEVILEHIDFKEWIHKNC